MVFAESDLIGTMKESARASALCSEMFCCPPQSLPIFNAGMSRSHAAINEFLSTLQGTSKIGKSIFLAPPLGEKLVVQFFLSDCLGLML